MRTLVMACCNEIQNKPWSITRSTVAFDLFTPCVCSLVGVGGVVVLSWMSVSCHDVLPIACLLKERETTDSVVVFRDDCRRTAPCPL